MKRRDPKHLWWTQMRVMMFGPRPLALFDRLWLVAISMIVVFLIGLSIHQGQVFRDNGIRRACASYGADERVFTRILDKVSINDADIRGDLSQARDQKTLLRKELNCPPYPAAPKVPEVNGD